MTTVTDSKVFTPNILTNAADRAVLAAQATVRAAEDTTDHDTRSLSWAVYHAAQATLTAALAQQAQVHQEATR